MTLRAAALICSRSPSIDWSIDRSIKQFVFLRVRSPSLRLSVCAVTRRVLFHRPLLCAHIHFFSWKQLATAHSFQSAIIIVIKFTSIIHERPEPRIRSFLSSYSYLSFVRKIFSTIFFFLSRTILSPRRVKLSATVLYRFAEAVLHFFVRNLRSKSNISVWWAPKWK